MNLTVGPLPPAVYWRRRAIVLGGLLLVVLLIAYACSGPSASNASADRGPSPTPATTSSAPAPLVGDGLSGSPSAPDGPSSAASAPASEPPLPSASPSSSVAATGVPICTDAQIRVTPVIASTSATTGGLVHGGTYDLKLKIRNISAVTCRRDVGSVPEQLAITNAAKAKIWSSDDCGMSKGVAHDVRTFGPDIEIYAEVKWSSYDITTKGCKKSAYPAPVGKYVLTGRVGTATGALPFTIVS